MIERNTKDKCNEFFSCPGDRLVPLFDSQVQKDGTVKLVITGQKDIQQEIDSWREQTDMAYILRQMAQGTYVQPITGMYADLTGLPNDMTEAMQIQINAEKAFYQLDLQTRNKFDNDFRKWLVMMNTDGDKFADLMGFVDNTDSDIKVGKDNVSE